MTVEQNMAAINQEEILRHTTAHIMAQAVLRLWPGTKIAIGPVIKNGFYYDFDLEHRFTPEDLEKIEEEMRKIIAEDLPIVREEISNAAAVALFKAENQDYKLELLEGLEEQVGIYRQGEFVDLCRDPTWKGPPRSSISNCRASPVPTGVTPAPDAAAHLGLPS